MPADPPLGTRTPMSTPASTGSLTVLFLAVFIDLLGFGLLLPLLPLYGKQFAAQPTIVASGIPIGVLIGLLMSSFSAMQFLAAPVWGRVSDRIGRRPVLLLGLAGSVVFYAGFGVATLQASFVGLLVSRIGAGIAGATIPTAHAYIADCTSPQERTRGMALIGAAFGLGFTFGPLFGLLAVPVAGGDPGPAPGFAAAGLSAVALALAYLRLPESLPVGASGVRRRRDTATLADVARAPGVGLLLAAAFVCVFSFSNFEATLALLISDDSGGFLFSFRELCLTFAFVGFASASIQGAIVPRLARRLTEARLAVSGVVLEIAGLSLVVAAAAFRSRPMLFCALAVTVAGFALVTPSLNALISQRSHPGRQGQVMGVTQGLGALARILGPLVGLPLFVHVGPSRPLLSAVALLVIGLGLVSMASRQGQETRAPG